MEGRYRYTVPAAGAGQRLDRFLGETITEISREKIKRAIQEGHCRVQGLAVTTPGTRLVPGQELEITLLVPPSGIEPEEGDIACLWQDAHMLVLNKPAGLTVHPCPSCPQGTLVQRLATHFPQLMRQEGQRPGIVHRLDKDTSGLLVVALTEESRLHLSASFAARDVRKEYLALVHGVPPLEGDIREPLGRHPLTRVKMAVVPESKGGKPAHTEWRVLYADPQNRFALLCVRIHTGRTHQIRVHLAHAGFPLWGDSVYGPRQSTDAPGSVSIDRQMLHAWRLVLPHPVSGQEMPFLCPPPPDMLKTALALSSHARRIIITGLPGCGKSALLRCLEARGLPVWSADAVVGELYEPGGDAQRFLRDRFGQRFVPQADAPVDRDALRQSMLDDATLRQEVETAVHAMVRHNLEKFWWRTAAEGHSLTAAEIPLYLEKGWSSEQGGGAPVLVGVSCPTALRHQRLSQHRGWNEERCQSMDSWQWPEERKLQACHIVVNNCEDLAALETATGKLLQDLESEEQEQKNLLAKQLEALWEPSSPHGDPTEGDAQ